MEGEHDMENQMGGGEQMGMGDMGQGHMMPPMAQMAPPPEFLQGHPPPPGVDFLQVPGGEYLAPPGEVGYMEMAHGGQLPSLMSMKVEKPPNMPAANDLRDQRLPHALEKALAFKTQRANEVGEENEAPADENAPPLANLQPAFDDIDTYEDEDQEKKSENKNAEKKGKNRKKRKKPKKKRVRENFEDDDDKEDNQKGPKVEIEYIQEKLNMFELDPIYRQFSKVFDNFLIRAPNSDLDSSKDTKSEDNLLRRPELCKVPKLPEEGEDPDDRDGKEDEKPKLSKRKQKKLTRLSIAELKQLVNRPDVVEMHDVTARDPKLLVQLKAHRNTVPVPRHWCFKRKYLQGKRGIEKPPFDLPDFIRRTGIMEMRSAVQEKDDQKTLKAKMRERARPKMGKIDIDYQKLHDAFFKWQTKPKLTIHGDLYYEGKEFETRLREKKPGDLSGELRTALGMPVGPGAHRVPPPWLIAMQRYGPPPSYPNLKIPGLNCPIPEGSSFGYHAGGWGKPPVDETGKPLYGDVFATQTPNSEIPVDENDIDKSIWGELESDSEEESEEEEEEEREEEDTSGLVTPAEGLVTPSGITSVPTGMETPDNIELRKKKIEAEMEAGESPALFQVLQEKRVDRLGSSMMASTHTYEVPQATSSNKRDAVEVALDPSELDLDSDAMAARYEAQMREQQSHLRKEDLSDMLQQHVNRQKNKRKSKQTTDSKQAKKYKEFKF